MMKIDAVESKGGYFPMQSTFLNKDPEKTADVVLTEEIGLSAELLTAWQKSRTLFLV